MLKRVYIKSIQSYLRDHEVDKMDPHDVIGRGGEIDMLCVAREAITEEVRKYIKIMEGSFGVEKNHYGLDRVKARIKPTEILWIFLVCIQLML